MLRLRERLLRHRLKGRFFRPGRNDFETSIRRQIDGYFALGEILKRDRLTRDKRLAAGDKLLAKYLETAYPTEDAQRQ